MGYKRGSSFSSGRTDRRWQWLFVGAVLGFGCASVGCLFLVTTGYLALNTEPQQLATEIVARDDEESQEEVAAQATICGPLEHICGEAVAAALLAVTTPAPAVSDSQPEDAGGGGEDAEAMGAAAVQPPADTPEPPDTPTPTNTPPPTSTPPPTNPPIDPRLASIVTDLVPVAGGTFQMGTNQQEAAVAVQECVDAGGRCEIGMAQDSFPPHTVTITSFQIERYEVNVSQYVAFLNVMGPGSHATGCGGRCAFVTDEDTTSLITFDGASYQPLQYMAERPVTHVTWFGANAYCAAIGRRLPTEAEWERAARGTEGYIYPWGWTFSGDLANTSAAAVGGTSPVGSYPGGASPFGAEDMAGNVAEWVYDWYQPDYYSTEQARQLNTQGPTSGTDRVIRGGAWDQRPFFSRTVHRLHLQPNVGTPWLGFRCVSDESPPPTVAAPAGSEAVEVPTATIQPTLDPNITPSPLPTLPPGG